MAEGSIYKRCACRDENRVKLGTKCPRLRRPGGGWSPNHGNWAYQFELPAGPNGKRRQLRRSGFDSRDDAIDERDRAKELLNLAAGDKILAADIATMLLACKSGDPLPDRDIVARRIRAGVPASTSITVGDYLWDWHAGRKIEESTLSGYAGHIRNYLEPHLGHIPLDKLQIAHIEAMFRAIEARNHDIEVARQSSDRELRASVKGIQTVSAATMHRIRATLRKALNDAIRVRRLLEFNPAAHLELPSGKRPKARVWTNKAVERWQATGERPSPVMVWTPAQAGAFLDYAESHDVILYPLFALILHRGLRRGEACGIRDTDLDLDNAVATISQQVTTIGYRTVTKKVKSDAGDRNIPLDQATVAALRAYAARRAGWKLLAGPDWPDTGRFFVKPDGQPWHPDTISFRFEHLLASSGLPPIRLHDLRHCAATYLRASGADLKTVQATLGHSSIVITNDTYTSVLLEFERHSSEAASKLIPRKRRRRAA